MWTNNGKKLLNKQLAGDAPGMGLTFTNVLGAEENQNYNSIISGVLTYNSYYVSELTGKANNQAALKYCLYVGTGTTEPTVGDITLEKPVAFSCPQAPTITMGTDGKNILINYILQNNTGEPHTITEIGLCAFVVSSTSANNVLFNRRLLENPVTIANGETYSFSFSWNTANLAE